RRFPPVSTPEPRQPPPQPNARPEGDISILRGKRTFLFRLDTRETTGIRGPRPKEKRRSRWASAEGRTPAGRGIAAAIRDAMDAQGRRVQQAGPCRTAR